MTLFDFESYQTCPTESTQNSPQAHSPQWRSVTAEVCHSCHPSAGDIRVTFSPPLWHSWRFLFCFFFHRWTPYLAEMKKSKQNQLTGGEKTLGENATQPPLRHRGPRETAAGYDAGFGDGPAEEGARRATTAGLGVVPVGPQVGVSREEGKGGPMELRSSLGQQKRSPLPEAPQTTACQRTTCKFREHQSCVNIISSYVHAIPFHQRCLRESSMCVQLPYRC